MDVLSMLTGSPAMVTECGWPSWDQYGVNKSRWLQARLSRYH